jgi:hypothetical protein
VGGVVTAAGVTGTGQIGADMPGTDQLPSARSARRVGGVMTAAGVTGSDCLIPAPGADCLPSARSARRVG